MDEIIKYNIFISKEENNLNNINNNTMVAVVPDNYSDSIDDTNNNNNNSGILVEPPFKKRRLELNKKNLELKNLFYENIDINENNFGLDFGLDLDNFNFNWNNNNIIKSKFEIKKEKINKILEEETEDRNLQRIYRRYQLSGQGELEKKYNSGDILVIKGILFENIIKLGGREASMKYYYVTKPLPPHIPQEEKKNRYGNDGIYFDTRDFAAIRVNVPFITEVDIKPMVSGRNWLQYYVKEYIFLKKYKPQGFTRLEGRVYTEDGCGNIIKIKTINENNKYNKYIIYIKDKNGISSKRKKFSDLFGEQIPNYYNTYYEFFNKNGDEKKPNITFACASVLYFACGNNYSKDILIGDEFSWEENFPVDFDLNNSSWKKFEKELFDPRIPPQDQSIDIYDYNTAYTILMQNYNQYKINSNSKILAIILAYSHNGNEHIKFFRHLRRLFTSNNYLNRYKNNLGINIINDDTLLQWKEYYENHKLKLYSKNDGNVDENGNPLQYVLRDGEPATIDHPFGYPSHWGCNGVIIDRYRKSNILDYETPSEGDEEIDYCLESKGLNIIKELNEENKKGKIKIVDNDFINSVKNHYRYLCDQAQQNDPGNYGAYFDPANHKHKNYIGSWIDFEKDNLKHYGITRKEYKKYKENEKKIAGDGFQSWGRSTIGNILSLKEKMPDNKIKLVKVYENVKGYYNWNDIKGEDADIEKNYSSTDEDDEQDREDIDFAPFSTTRLLQH